MQEKMDSVSSQNWMEGVVDFQDSTGTTVKYHSSDTLYKFGHCRVFFLMVPVSCDQRTAEKIHYTVLNNIEGS